MRFTVSAPRTVPQKLPKVRLRTTLVVTFVVQIVAAVGLVGYLSFRNAQKAVNTLASQLRSELSARIQQELKSYFENPYRLNQLNSRAFLRGELNVANVETVFPLLDQLKISPFLYAIYCGTSQGEFLGAVRILDDNSIGLWTANPWTGQHLYLYNIDTEGRPTTLKRDSGTIYDPRQRPWYQKAQQTGSPVWTDIYLAFSTGLPTVTASQPIYDPTTGDLLGVCATDVLLPDDFRKFLSSLPIGKSGIAFVSDRTGQLLSSSTNEPLSVGEGKQAKLLPAIDSQNPLIRGATRQLLHQYGSFATLEQSLQTEFTLQGERQFVQVLPFKDGRGLDWLIVVVIPESDFMDEINANNRLTILLCFVALAIAILAGMITSRWISEPILKLSSASKAIAQGELDQHIKAKGITELEILASSFNTMTYQLQESFAKLEAKNADLQQAKEALSAAKEQLEAVLNAVPGSISWMSSEGIYLGVNRDLADRLSLQPEEIIGREIGFFQNSSDYVKFLRQFLASPEQSASQILPILYNEQRRYYLIVVQKYQQGGAIVTVGIDITERRQAEEALRIAEENYRSIYENALEGIFQYNPQHSYINVNPAMARIYGYDSPHALMEILKDSDYPLYVEPERHKEFINLMQQQETISNFEFQIYRADHHKIWISASAKPVFDGEGNLLYYQGFIADITQRKKAEVERQQFIEELFEVNSNLEIAMQTQLELTEAATRFVPQEFLSLLGYNSIAEVKLGEGVQHEMSILFSDIRDFTSISEKMTPEDNFQFINSYLSRMEPAITQHQGFIDKYIGDAIMALFNGGADDAIQAGITMLKALEEYNSKRGQPHRPKVSIGIGINTGILMLGTVGGENRMDSTVISDAVNLASRIEGVTKYFGVPLLISEHTLKALHNPSLYAIRLMGRINVKGKSEKVSVFEVFDADSPIIKEGKLATKVIFEEAVSLHTLQKHQEAIKAFETCLTLNPIDRVAKLYLEHIHNQLEK